MLPCEEGGPIGISGKAHEEKLRIIPEDFAQALADLAERPDLMYDVRDFETADRELRSWGLHLLGETEALEKLEQRKREKQQSLYSTVTGRRGMRWVSSLHDSPNWPLDETFDEDGVSKHDLYEQWTPLLDDHVDYDAIQYLYERYPEVCEQLESSGCNECHGRDELHPSGYRAVPLWSDGSDSETGHNHHTEGLLR